MKVTIPKNKKAEKFLEYAHYEKIDEDENHVTYEGVQSFAIPFNWGKMYVPKGERRKFYERTKVEGGQKIWREEEIAVVPVRNKRFTLQVSKDERELIRHWAEISGLSMSEIIRTEVHRLVSEWLEEKHGGRDEPHPWTIG